MKAQMAGYGGRDWDEFIDSRKIWVTEFNCNNDNVGHDLPDVFPAATSSEACSRITGRAESWKANNKTRSWGRGAVHMLEELPSIQRYAWSSVWSRSKGSASPSRLLNAQLVDESGRPYPHGRALLRGLDPASCSEVAATTLDGNDEISV